MSTVGENKRRAIHVGVNAHLLSLDESYRSAGINWYIYNLLQHLPQAGAGIEYTVFLSEQRYAGAAGIQLLRSRLPGERPLV
ncbi:MAG TPA: hypothetical protein VLY63_24530, partial [Anaerolineae bacterium]|nr:hypothetical protein [Anaerolineae bacterium]